MGSTYVWLVYVCQIPSIYALLISKYTFPALEAKPLQSMALQAMRYEAPFCFSRQLHKSGMGISGRRWLSLKNSICMAGRHETIKTGLRRAEQWRNKGKELWNFERKMKSTPPVVHAARFIAVLFFRFIAVAWMFRAVKKVLPALTSLALAFPTTADGILAPLASHMLTAQGETPQCSAL